MDFYYMFIIQGDLMDEKMFSLMEKMYGEMQKIGSKVDSLESKVDKIETRTDSIKKTVIKIENDHGKKLEALLDVYKQNSEKLAEIDKKVSKHEEFIITRVK